MFSQSQPLLVHAPPSQPPFPPLNTHSPTISNTLFTQNNKHISIPLLTGKLNSTTYSSILDSCNCPLFGKQVHAHLLKNGFHGREYIQTKLLKMYAKFGFFQDLFHLFDKMPNRNLYTYTALLNLLLEDGLFREALVYFERLLLEDIELEFFVFPVAFKICSGRGGVELGKQLHGLATKVGISSHVYVGNALIDMYGRCGSVVYAEKVLDNLLARDAVSWNTIITACSGKGMVFDALRFLEEMSVECNLSADFVSWSSLVNGFVQNGYDQEAIELLYRMRAEGCEPNARTLTIVLPSCARLGKVRLGKQIYGYVTRHGFMSFPYVVNGLIDLYRRCDDMESALSVFSGFSERDEVSFNTMIAGYCDTRNIIKAKELFDQMKYERKLNDLISWNSMISGYANNSMFTEALQIFINLLNKGGILPNSFTLGSALSTCANIGSLRLGKGLHSYSIVKGLESNLFVSGALVEMYCKCQDIESAVKTLHKLPKRDIAIWNSLASGYGRLNHTENIRRVLQQMKEDGFEPNVYTYNGIVAGCVENGHHELALHLLTEMQASEVRPDLYTIGILLPACAKLATLGRGKQIHAHAIRFGFESDLYILAALTDMYAKCGNLIYAEFVHNCTKHHNLVTKNAMLNAYALHGRGKDGIVFFHEMLFKGYEPDGVTFLAVLSSCVHAGSVDTGKEVFVLMKKYGVIPTLKHYTCMVDLMSRAGKLKEGYEMIEHMSVAHDSVIWSALLGGCIIHGDFELGEIAANKVMELEGGNAGNYVMLANLYAGNGKWDELREIRKRMKVDELYKDPGCSWIEGKDEIHVFMAYDKSHRKGNDIYEMLDDIAAHMRFEQVYHVLQLIKKIVQRGKRTS